MSISQKSYTLLEFTVEFSARELKHSILNQKFTLPENNFAWTVKKKFHSVGGNYLILDSCDNPQQVLKVHVLLFNYDKEDACWRKEPYEMRIILPEELTKLPKEVMEFGEAKKKIEFIIYFKSDSTRSSVDKMIEYYSNLMKNEETSDITLMVGHEKFSAHKLILSTRSSVFAAMFNCDMLEKQTGSVEINDIAPEIFKLFLEYIYTGQITVTDRNTDVNWFKLMIAADKYAIDSLKEICSQKLAENLNTDNVIDTLIMSDRFRDDKLKKISSSFFIQNKKEIVSTEKYKKMTESNVDMVIELFHEIMSCEYSIRKK